MRYLARLALLIVVGLFLCVGFSYTVGSSGRGAGRNLGSWYLYEFRRAEALQNCSRIMCRAQEVKHTVIHALLARKLTVREAAEQFAAVDESLAEESSGLPMAYHAPQTEAEVQKQLLGWVKSELATNPRQAEEAIRRVEEELAEASTDTE